MVAKKSSKVIAARPSRSGKTAKLVKADNIESAYRGQPISEKMSAILNEMNPDVLAEGCGNRAIADITDIQDMISIGIRSAKRGSQLEAELRELKAMMDDFMEMAKGMAKVEFKMHKKLKAMQMKRKEPYPSPRGKAYRKMMRLK